MKLSTLLNKLSKLKIESEVVNNNDYNKTLKFSLNNKKYEATYNSKDLEVDSYSYSYGYDDASQETQRRFFDNFNQVKRHSERN